MKVVYFTICIVYASWTQSYLIECFFYSWASDDTIGDLKKLIAAQVGTRPEKIRIQKWYTIYKDHVTLADYEIHDGMGLELYYN